MEEKKRSEYGYTMEPFAGANPEIFKDKISSEGFSWFHWGRCDAQSQTQELYCRLIRQHMEREGDRERISGKRGWDYESPQPLLSPLLACLSMTPANTVTMKSLKLHLETPGRLFFFFLLHKLLASNGFQTPEKLTRNMSQRFQHLIEAYKYIC